MIYGISPCDESSNINIRPVMTLTAPVISIKECKEGDSIGYGQTYKIKKDTRIAALGIGYGDGVPRRLSNIGKVFFQGHIFNIVGRVSMDIIMIDIKNISKDELPNQLNSYDVLLVRSATKVRADLMDKAPNLKMIGRGGVGMDNIDVEYAKSKNIEVFNTPKASSQSVAELVIAHLLCIARSLYISNAQMPSKGDVEFKSLKKVAGKNGFETPATALNVSKEIGALEPATALGAMLVDSIF